MTSTELELWHFWPDCFNYPCYECFWWDICYWLAMNDIQVNWHV